MLLCHFQGSSRLSVPCTALDFRIEKTTVRFGAVLSMWKSEGAVRFDFSHAVISTLRLVAVSIKRTHTLRCCSVWSCILRSGSVGCSENSNPTVRLGAVSIFSTCYRAVRCCGESYGAVRCGCPLNSCCVGARPVSVGKIVHKTCFPYAAPYKKTWFRAVLKLCSVHYRNHCFSTVHRMSKTYNNVFVRLLAQY